MDGFDGIPTSALMKAAGMRSKRMNGVGDFVEPFIESIRPATSMPHPPGPADFPVQVLPTTPTTEIDLLTAILGVLRNILAELIKQNIAANPVTRAQNIDSTGETLNWTAVGIMDRLMIRNKGANSVWISFDINGPAVDAFTSDLSFELQANESINLTHCAFQKIGCKCAGGQTATVHAIAFQTVAGNQAGAIS